MLTQKAKDEVAKAKNITVEPPKPNVTEKVEKPASPPEKSVNDLLAEGKSLAEV